MKGNKAHSGAVNAICIYEDTLLTGSNDQTIKIWDADSLKVRTTINCQTLLEGSVCAKIRALDVFDRKIVVGTFGSQIYQL